MRLMGPLWRRLARSIRPRSVQVSGTGVAAPSFFMDFGFVTWVFLSLWAILAHPVGFGEQAVRYLYDKIQPTAPAPLVVVEFDDHTETQYPHWMGRSGLLCVLEYLADLKPRAIMLDVYFGHENTTDTSPPDCAAATVPTSIPVIGHYQATRSGAWYEFVQPDQAVGLSTLGHALVDRPNADAPVSHIKLWLERGTAGYVDYLPSISLLTAWHLLAEEGTEETPSLPEALAACRQGGDCQRPLDILPPRAEMTLDEFALSQGIVRISAARFIPRPEADHQTALSRLIGDAAVVVGYTAESTGDTFQVGTELAGQNVPGVLLHAVGLRQILEGRLHTPATWKENLLIGSATVGLAWVLSYMMYWFLRCRCYVGPYAGPMGVFGGHVLSSLIFLFCAMWFLATFQTLLAATAIGTALVLSGVVLIITEYMGRQRRANDRRAAFRRHCGGFYDVDPAYWHTLLNSDVVQAVALKVAVRPGADPDVYGLSVFQRRVLSNARKAARDLGRTDPVRVFVTAWHENSMTIYVLGEDARALAEELAHRIGRIVAEKYPRLLEPPPPEDVAVRFVDIDSPTEDDLVAVFHNTGAAT